MTEEGDAQGGEPDPERDDPTSDDDETNTPREDAPTDVRWANAPESADEVEELLVQARALGRGAWQELRGQDGYLPVLLLLFGALVAPPLIGDSRPGAFITIAIVSAAVVVTVYRSTHRSKIRRFATFTAAGVALVGCVAVFGADVFSTEERGAALLVSVLTSLLLLAAFPLVLIRSFLHPRVTINTLCATLSAYLIIGLVFASLYQIMNLVHGPFFAQANSARVGTYNYFSVVTLTTLGYGDYTPATDPGRAAAMVEAILGQVFLVTALARVVSLLGHDRPLVERTTERGNPGVTRR